jgi:hypothetical protein
MSGVEGREDYRHPTASEKVALAREALGQPAALSFSSFAPIRGSKGPPISKDTFNRPSRSGMPWPPSSNFRSTRRLSGGSTS